MVDPSAAGRDDADESPVPSETGDPAGRGPAVTIPESILARFDRFTLFNSPYPAHDRGCAIDLYPPSNAGISPVAGEVLDTRTVRCPSRPYAVDTDHLVLVAVDGDWADRHLTGAGTATGTATGTAAGAAAGAAEPAPDLVARVLHVDPAVDPGDRVAVGDSLGEMVRSGFFGQWVDNHVHLGFRPADANAYRATGSVPVGVDVAVRGLPWDGTGTVVETGPTHALLDRPAHPAPGEAWATVAADDGRPLDGGLVHYPGGGVLGGDGHGSDTVSLLGTTVGTAAGRHVDWAAVAVLADGRRATGLSLFAARDDFGAKLVFHEGHDLAVGDEVSVAIRPSDDPVVLG